MEDQKTFLLTLEEALNIAKRSKSGFGCDISKIEITIKEAIEIMEYEIKHCWFNWITGREALAVLKNALRGNK